MFGAGKPSWHFKVPQREVHSLGGSPNLGRAWKPFLWGRGTGPMFECLRNNFCLQGQRNCYMSKGHRFMTKALLAGVVCFINDSCESKAESLLPAIGLFPLSQLPFSEPDHVAILSISAECFPDYKMLSHTLSCFHILTVFGARQGVMILILQLSPREAGWLKWLSWLHSRGRI